MNNENNEVLPVVNEQGEVLARAKRGELHGNKEKKILHPVVHLHLFNPKGELFLQLRPMHKLIQPGKWDTAVGGHVSFGESIQEALIREAEEEIGIDPRKAVLLTNYIWESDMERELVYLHTLHSSQTPKINAEELADGRFWTMDEIKDNLGKAVFTTNFEREVSFIF